MHDLNCEIAQELGVLVRRHQAAHTVASIRNASSFFEPMGKRSHHVTAQPPIASCNDHKLTLEADSVTIRNHIFLLPVTGQSASCAASRRLSASARSAASADRNAIAMIVACGLTPG